MNNTMKTNNAAATRFIEAFNTDDWDSVSQVVAPTFVLHHPMGGTNELGPEGMVAVWSHFKAALPDSWHPIPVMITEGDYLANLLPTYGHFTGDPHQGIPPTGKWLEYGMVNIVRLEDGVCYPREHCAHSTHLKWLLECASLLCLHRVSLLDSSRLQEHGCP